MPSRPARTSAEMYALERTTLTGSRAGGAPAGVAGAGVAVTGISLLADAGPGVRRDAPQPIAGSTGPNPPLTGDRQAGLHVAPVLPTHLEERLGDLLQRTHPGGIHEHGKDVLTRRRRRLEPRDGLLRLDAVLRLVGRHPRKLALLLALGGAREDDLPGGVALVRVAEGVDADDGQRAVVLAVLVEHRLVLDPPALVAGLHRPEHPAPLGDPVELGEHGGLDQVGELVDDEGALQRVLVDRETPLLGDDHL